MTVIIGVDPHKSSHTATAVDPSTNTRRRVVAHRRVLVGYRELMRWASQFPQRRWAVEGARGWVVTSRSGSSPATRSCSTSPSTATARARAFAGGRRKTDVIDAAAAASVGAARRRHDRDR